MNILFIDQNFDASNIGGAFKSNYAIIREFRKNPEFNILVIASKATDIRTKKFSVKKIRPILKAPSKKLNTLIKYFKINQYFSFFPILIEIKRFKPNFIIVQRDLSFSAILAGFFKKIPVINIIRDAMALCPKEIDTKGFKNCTNQLIKKECWECINNWRTLRILLDDKPLGSNVTMLSSFYTLYYKIQYFFTKLYLYLIKYAYVNIVASPSMKELIEKRTKDVRVLVRRITPVENSSIKINSGAFDKGIIDRIERSNKIILFIIPRNEGGSKGYPFVKKLLKEFPEDYLLIVVGTIFNELTNFKNVINIDKVLTKNLYYLYRKANVTIVPSIYTEAFGRVILESIINKTPVIASAQTSANYIFKKKNYVKVLSLKSKLWLETIEEIINDPIKIPDTEIRTIELLFSPEECAKELAQIIYNFKK